MVAEFSHYVLSAILSLQPQDILTVKLERVLGFTVASNAALDCDETSGNIAYPAGKMLFKELLSEKYVHPQF
ncbi:WDR62 [Cordylochernes scorpioides]|uniref:WDR62 n=1 Tax=Cordylochernes scorpioides TaxID=51811 RepID=A0ABY6LQ27_9ARAC|nr:WDR62 [Cordylochernes scorpioides]